MTVVVQLLELAAMLPLLASQQTSWKSRGSTADLRRNRPVTLLLQHRRYSRVTCSDSSLEGDGKEPYVTYTVRLAFSTYNSCIHPVIFPFVSADLRDKASRVLCCHSNSEDSPTHTKTMCHILHRGQKSR